MALPVNELAKVEQDMKLDAVAVPCAACFSRFKTGAHEVAESEQTAADVRAVVGRAYNGGVAVDNLIDVYHDAVGLEALDAKEIKPFNGLKVACYYGSCSPGPPRSRWPTTPSTNQMDEVVENLGCEAVDWNYKTDCCGASLALTEQGIVDDLVGRILTDAKACGAQAVIVACPLCQVNLDGRQIESPRRTRAGRASPWCSSANWWAVRSASTTRRWASRSTSWTSWR